MKQARFEALVVKRPCIGCIYYPACGSTTRTEPCDGRMTKAEKRREELKEVKR